MTLFYRLLPSGRIGRNDGDSWPAPAPEFRPRSRARRPNRHHRHCDRDPKNSGTRWRATSVGGSGRTPADSNDVAACSAAAVGACGAPARRRRAQDGAAPAPRRQRSVESPAGDAGPVRTSFLEGRGHGRAGAAEAPHLQPRMRGHSHSSRVARSVTNPHPFPRHPGRRRFARCRRAVAYSPRNWISGRRHPDDARRR